jgi:hypothetical protein
MPPEAEKATLSDIVNYQPEEYLSEGEIDLIRRTFKGNKELLKVLRKVFMPTAMDPELPIEQMGQDAWMVDKDWSALPLDEAKALMVARCDTIKFVLGGLVKLNVLANTKVETEADKKARLNKDSNK